MKINDAMKIIDRRLYTVYVFSDLKTDIFNRKKEILARLRLKHPGTLESNVKIASMAKNNALVFVFKKRPENLKNMLCSTLIARICAIEGNARIIFNSPDWSEIVMIVDSTIVSSQIGAPLTHEVLVELQNSNNSDLLASFLYHTDERSKLNSSSKSINSLSFSARQKRSVTLYPAFNIKPLFGFFSIFLLFIFVLMYINTQSVQERMAREHVAKEQQKLLERMRQDELDTKLLQSEYEELFNDYIGLLRLNPVAPYDVLDVLYECFGSLNKIIAITIMGAAFQVEADSLDAIPVFSMLENHRYIYDPRLHISRVDQGREKFTVSGYVLRGYKDIDTSLPLPQRIRAIRDLILHENSLKKADDFVLHHAAALEVKKALIDSSCNLRTYQFFYSASQTEIEFSVYCPPLNFLRFLFLYRAAKDMPRVTSIKIQNSVSNHQSDIVFRVAYQNALPEGSFPVVTGEYMPSFLPNQINTAFIYPKYVNPVVVDLPATVDLPQQNVEKTGFLYYIGVVRNGSGSDILYVRDSQSETIVRFVPGQEGENTYTVVAQSIYHIRYKSRIFEIRRN